MGHVHIGEVEAASINYCLEYALKREKQHALVELRREPEFAVMSTKPAIGAYAISEIRQAILKSDPLPTGELLIPDHFTLLGKNYPIPRFIRNQLEDEGFLYAPKAVRQYITDKQVLHALCTRSRAAQEEFKKFETLWDSSRLEEYTVFKGTSPDILRQKLLNAESRRKIYGGRHETQ